MALLPFYWAAERKGREGDTGVSCITSSHKFKFSQWEGGFFSHCFYLLLLVFVRYIAMYFFFLL